MRVLVAAIAGGLCALRAYLTATGPDWPDLTQLWVAARGLLAGHDPYALVGPGRAFNAPYVLMYPLTAVVPLLPLARLALPVASATFAGIAGGAFAYALTATGWWPLVGMLSGSMLIASQEAQWSPLLAASTVVLPLGVVAAAKPTIATAMFCARPSWWPIGGGLVLLALAFALEPHWLQHWWAAIHTTGPGRPAPYYAPVTLGIGPLIPLALLRWKRPEARLLAVLALIPQTVGLYESVPLFLVPRTWWEALSLLALSYVFLWWVVQHRTLPDAARLRASGEAVTWLLYLPAMLMVLRRPNEASR